MLIFAQPICYFNPLPRKEGDIFSMAATPSLTISIHSLVKRETRKSHANAACCAISIRSLVKRETNHPQNFPDVLQNFNPLPRKEGDDDYFSLTETAMHFNPLPRKEGDSKFR